VKRSENRWKLPAFYRLGAGGVQLVSKSPSKSVFGVDIIQRSPSKSVFGVDIIQRSPSMFLMSKIDRLDEYSEVLICKQEVHLLNWCRK
jgi:hypothetical protein